MSETYNFHNKKFWDREQLFHLYFRGTGRIGRLRYLQGYLFLLLCVFLLALIIQFITDNAFVAKSLPGILILVSLIPIMRLVAKRIQDMEMSPWLVLLIFVPLANVVLGLMCLFRKGTNGKNKYGHEPV